MCNLNLFIKAHKKNHKKLKDIINLLNCTTTNSFINNNDGDGVYFEYKNLLVKSKNKINFIDYQEHIKKSNFILSHQRLATHGLTDKYIQPFKNKDFVLLHNGILSEYAKKDYSDTYGFFKEFNKEFLENTKKSRELNILEAIKKTLNGNSGSFSICIFDIKTKTIYYFKNGYTSINFYRNKNKKEVYITTAEANNKILNLYGEFEEMQFYDYDIYKIRIKDKKVLYSIVDKLKQPKIYVNESYNKSLSCFSNLYIHPNKEFNKVLEQDGYELKKFKKCCLCSRKTRIYNRFENSYYCLDCLNEGYE